MLALVSGLTDAVTSSIETYTHKYQNNMYIIPFTHIPIYNLYTEQTRFKLCTSYATFITLSCMIIIHCRLEYTTARERTGHLHVLIICRGYRDEIALTSIPCRPQGEL